MARKQFDISILIQLKDKMTPAMRSVTKSLDKLNSPLRRVNSSMRRFSQRMAASSDRMKKIGSTMTRRISLPMSIFGALTLRTAAKFQSSMNNVQAITRTTGKELEKMTELAKKMGAETQFSASESADAMGFLAMAGLSVKEVIAALPGTLELAAAGSLDLAEAADISTNVLKAMQLGVDDLARVNDVMALSASKANLDVRQLSEAMRPIASTASTMGIEIEELSSLLGKMADAGQKGSIAGTLLRNAMIRLVKGGPKVESTFRNWGLRISDFVTKSGKLQNFTQLVTELGKKSVTTKDLIKAFGDRGSRAMQDLLKSGGPAINKLTKELKNSQGVAEEMAKTKMQGLPGALKKLKSAFESVQIAIAESGLVEFAVKMANKLAELFKWFKDLSPKTKKWILTLVALLAVLGPIVKLLGFISGLKMISRIGSLAKAFKGVTSSVKLLSVVMKASPLLLILGAAVALAGALWGWLNKSKVETAKEGKELNKLDKQISKLSKRLKNLSITEGNRVERQKLINELVGLENEKRKITNKLQKESIETDIRLGLRKRTGATGEELRKAGLIGGGGELTRTETLLRIKHHGVEADVSLGKIIAGRKASIKTQSGRGQSSVLITNQ